MLLIKRHMSNLVRKYKSRVVYIGLTVIVLIHAVLNVIIDEAEMDRITEIIFKVLMLLSIIFSIVAFRAFVFPFFCRIIERKYKDINANN